jgi:inner membrane protein
MKLQKTNLYIKTASILLIALLLLIPAAMIQSLIHEREQYYREAVREVSAKWSTEQTIIGPVLTIPFQRYTQQGNEKDMNFRQLWVREYLHLLPETLNVSGEVMPSTRKRGIYKVVLYQTDLKLEGTFDLSALDLQTSNNIKYLPDEAFVSVGMNDLRGIENNLALDWNGSVLDFNPGIPVNDFVQNGVHVPVKLDGETTAKASFSVHLQLKGSQQLLFAPVGRSTYVQLTSSWADPSFTGSFLPYERTVNDQGFTAEWRITHLNRSFPQQWIGSKHDVSQYSFGLDLLLPVDSYQKTYRTVRYAALFIGFTFLVFFFTEVLKRTFIHPVQYTLVGLALVVFFTLLLSISEHLHFNLAYIIASLSTLTLVGLYIHTILRNRALTWLIASLLLLLYAFIFVILQLQDLALLAGSIGVFVLLATVMYLSRKVDWYHLQRNE